MLEPMQLKEIAMKSEISYKTSKCWTDADNSRVVSIFWDCFFYSVTWACLKIDYYTLPIEKQL